MTNINKIDYELYLNLIKNDYAFRTPIDYPYPYSSYDIIANKNNECFFPLYQNNLILSIDLNNNFKILPFKVDHCHGLFRSKNFLVASCYRKSKILIFNCLSLKLVKSFNLKNEYPISSVIYKNKLFYIDYKKSTLKFINFKENFKTSINTSLLRNQKNPHSLKLKDNVMCITLKNPSQILVYVNLEFYKAKFFSREFEIFSASPISKNLLLISFINKGIYFCDLQNDLLVLISKNIPRPTSIAIMRNELFITSESSKAIHRIKNWKKLIK